MWNDSNYKIINIMDNIGKRCFPEKCSICQNSAVHIFFYRYRKSYGGMWLWCSNCQNSSHTSGLVPEWWANPDFISSSKLTALPDYLENNKAFIDKWVNMLIKENLK